MLKILEQGESDVKVHGLNLIWVYIYDFEKAKLSLKRSVLYPALSNIYAKYSSPKRQTLPNLNEPGMIVWTIQSLLH